MSGSMFNPTIQEQQSQFLPQWQQQLNSGYDSAKNTLNQAANNPNNQAVAATFDPNSLNKPQNVSGLAVPQMGGAQASAMGRMYSEAQGSGDAMKAFYGDMLKNGGMSNVNSLMSSMGQQGQLANDQARSQAMAQGGGGSADMSRLLRTLLDSNLQNQVQQGQFAVNQNNQMNQNRFNAAQGMGQIPGLLAQPVQLETQYQANVQNPVMMQNQQVAMQNAQADQEFEKLLASIGIQNAGSQNQANQFNIGNNLSLQQMIAQLSAQQGQGLANLGQQSTYAYEQPSIWQQYLAPLLGTGASLFSGANMGGSLIDQAQRAVTPQSAQNALDYRQLMSGR
jgi:hypothetical protein